MKLCNVQIVLIASWVTVGGACANKDSQSDEHGTQTITSLNTTTGRLEPDFDPAHDTYVLHTSSLANSVGFKVQYDPETLAVSVNDLEVTQQGSYTWLSAEHSAIVNLTAAPLVSNHPSRHYTITIVQDMKPTTQQVSADTVGAGANFGRAVAVSDTDIAVASQRQNTVTIYRRSDDSRTWHKATTLVAPEGAPQSTGPDSFGTSLALSDKWLFVGASAAEAVYVYEKVNERWVYNTKLTAKVVQEGAAFGASVAFVDATLVVGAPFEDLHTATNSGAVYVFTHDGAAWASPVQLKAFFSEGDVVRYTFGRLVALSSSHIFVGGEVFAGFPDRAFVFRKTGSTWRQQQTLKPQPKSNRFDDNGIMWNFGEGLVAQKGRVFVGARGGSAKGQEHFIPTWDFSGRVSIWTEENGVWLETARIKSPTQSDDAHFGTAISAFEDNVAVGAYKEDALGHVDSGSVYVFKQRDGEWQLKATLTPELASPNDRYGEVLALHKNVLVSGAPLHDHLQKPMVSDSGSAYIHE